ncbi:helix-turn-helix domain-containing protein [Mycoavidus sp. SF9855]|uniref:helix-turn-helix domain-containing protein n=1 Tax=Mycoavidus sp. SF9855 TaxID=2968475 RepID=UPI00211C4D36|nr:helix-turn-helix domain-containing protein [Mycoavidus sp. SF9855]UUM20738.1 helix-turn-helix domain-containing protein [Mycoavidus sp. SF9855]
MMLERQREGVLKAKTAGKYKGRKPIASDHRQNVIRLAAEGATKANVASQLTIGEATVYRILAAQKSRPSPKNVKLAKKSSRRDF